MDAEDILETLFKGVRQEFSFSIWMRFWKACYWMGCEIQKEIEKENGLKSAPFPKTPTRKKSLSSKTATPANEKT